MELQPMNDFTPRRKKKRKMLCANCGINLDSSVEVSIPGLNRLRDPKYKKRYKFLWINFVTICSAVCIYLTFDRLTEYFSYPTSTKTDVQRNSTVKYPTFSICTFENNLAYVEKVEEIVVEKCKEKYSFENLSEKCESVPFKELNINIDQVWDEMYSFEIRLNFSDSVISESDFTWREIRTIFGKCKIITNNVPKPFLRRNNGIRAKINENNLKFMVVLHGLPTEWLNGWEFLYYPSNEVANGETKIIKFTEAKFISKNDSNNECFGLLDEIYHTENCIENIFRALNVCRLPFLSEKFEECESLSKLTKDNFYSALFTFFLLVNETCPQRRLCDDTIYSTIVDSVVQSKNPNETIIEIDFATGSTVVQSVYYTYSFAALISDLFAYWGFFAALNAFVFAEIFEFIISKIYCSFKK